MQLLRNPIQKYVAHEIFGCFQGPLSSTLSGNLHIAKGIILTPTLLNSSVVSKAYISGINLR